MMAGSSMGGSCCLHRVSWVNKMFMDKASSDLKVVFENGDRKMTFPGHSFVLSAKSAVFQRMIQADNFKEGATKTVVLKGVCLDVAYTFFRYLYFEVLPELSYDGHIHLLHAADMYDIPDLKNYCDQILCYKITNLSDVCDIYDRLVSLKIVTPCVGVALSTIGKVAGLIFRNEMHLCLSKEAFSNVLDGTLNIRKEDEILRALWSWGCKVCVDLDTYYSTENVTETVRDLLPKVRWGLLDPVEEDHPFFNLVYQESAKNHTNSNEERVVVKVNDDVGLMRHSSQFALSRRESWIMDLPGLRKMDFIGAFSVNRGIMITGFRMHVWMLGEDLQPDCKDISFPYSQNSPEPRTDDNIPNEPLVTGRVSYIPLLTHEKYSFMDVSVEFYNPIELEPLYEFRLYYDDPTLDLYTNGDVGRFESQHIMLSSAKNAFAFIHETSQCLDDVFYVFCSNQFTD